MTVRLVNSAIMPLPGIYHAHMIDKQEFGKILVQSNKDGNLVAYIGYESTLDYVQRITGVSLEINRDLTLVEDGDMLLVIRLNYRMHPDHKGRIDPIDDDFQFMKVFYCKEKL